MSVGRLYAANGIQLGQAYELDAIAAVILGGTSFVGGIGSIWGTLIGALIIAVMSNGLILTGVPDIWQYIVKGLVIIGAVMLDRFRQSTHVRRMILLPLDMRPPGAARSSGRRLPADPRNRIQRSILSPLDRRLRMPSE